MTPQHIKLYIVRSTFLFYVFLIAPGNVPQVAQASCWIRFALTTAYHLLIYEDVLSVEVILG